MVQLLVQRVQEASTMAVQRDLEAVCCPLWRVTLHYGVVFSVDD